MPKEKEKTLWLTLDINTAKLIIIFVSFMYCNKQAIFAWNRKARQETSLDNDQSEYQYSRRERDAFRKTEINSNQKWDLIVDQAMTSLNVGGSNM